MKSTSFLGPIFAIDELFGLEGCRSIIIDLVVHLKLRGGTHMTTPRHLVLRDLHGCRDLIATCSVELSVHELVVIDQGRSRSVGIQILHTRYRHSTGRMEERSAEILASLTPTNCTGLLLPVLHVLRARS